MVYEYWLASIKPLQPKKKRMLRENLGSGRTVYYIEETKLHFQEYLNAKDVETIRKAQGDKKIEERWARLKEENIRFIPYFSREYPEKLKHIPNPPYALYVKGSLPKEDSPSAAIVGARRCTPYGEQMALAYGEKLAKAGVQVISGMARGIDGAGQRGALNGRGRTYGILGCGVDVCYPREHIGLYMDLQENGGLISEQIPGQPPLPAYFPERNRIISGLSDVVLIIEAKETERANMHKKSAKKVLNSPK